LVIFPARVLLIWFSIFIASITRINWPASMVSPSLTAIERIAPGMGALMPSPPAGAGPGPFAFQGFAVDPQGGGFEVEAFDLHLVFCIVDIQFIGSHDYLSLPGRMRI
jgi:hypothetical protein